MNNDISDVNKLIRPVSQSKMSVADETAIRTVAGENVSKASEDMENSMNYLGAMGYAQVNMNNPLTKGVRASVDSFLNDPEYAAEHTEMCDKLVEEGYPLEEAIDVTDKIFDNLKTEDTYKK